MKIFTKIKQEIPQRINIRKVTVSAILINSFQIMAVGAVVVLSALHKGYLISGKAEILTLSGMALVVVWGAVVDIREAFAARHAYEISDMLEYANTQLVELNNTLRAQRHDFMNHLQVVYSLTEMNEHAEVATYIEKVYTDILRVGLSLKTAIPAVNALLAAKMSDCAERGIRMRVEIESAWEDMPVPGWELCRVLGNLIDNTIEALKDTQNPTLTVRLSENVFQFEFAVTNNGPVISKENLNRIFQTGFSTKSTGRGMGLAIVKQIVESHQGNIGVVSDAESTCFSGAIRKPASV